MNSRPQDGFERYFAEKIWEMLPAIYRHEDGLAENPHVLRSVVEALAEQFAILRRSHDRSWDDQFIDLCDDWAVPYLADLVGTRLVSVLNARARRIDTAKTIYYRRRKGTPRVLEELIGDIAGWEGKVVENFRRLSRSRHRLDPVPRPLAGRLTGTLPGGWADMRSARAAALVGSAFDEFHYTPDVRRHHGLRGRYAIAKVALHVYRRRVFPLIDGTPRKMFGEYGFTFDPSGRSIPLFMPRRRFPQDADSEQHTDWDDWISLSEWELPAPMRCRVLGHVEFEITEQRLAVMHKQGLISPAQGNELRKLAGWRYLDERSFMGALDSYSSLDVGALRAVATASMVEDCGKRALVPSAVTVRELPDVVYGLGDVVAGNLESWDREPPDDTRAIVDPERGRFRLRSTIDEGVTVTYHYGWPGEIGACQIDRPEAQRGIPDVTWTQGTPAGIPRSGILEIEDDRSYQLPPGTNVDLNGHLTLRAANQRRPYVAIPDSLVFDIDSAIPPSVDPRLTIDGLWFGGGGQLRIDGDFESVQIRHVTLDPGGSDTHGNVIAETRLVITGHVERLEIEQSITGPIGVEVSGGHVENLVVRDSILQARQQNNAVDLPGTNLDIKNATVFGSLVCRRVAASELITTGSPQIADLQTGCFRFSAAPVGSALPRPYRSHPMPSEGWRTFFASREFGDPNFARLSAFAPSELREGAENGSEMGAFNEDIEPIRFASLATKVGEYLPFGLVPIFMNET